MAQKTFAKLLQLQQTIALKSGRKFKLKKPAVPQHPTMIQMEYMAQLGKIAALHRSVIASYVRPRLDRIISQAQAHKKDGLKFDDYAQEIEYMIQNYRLQIAQEYSDAEIKQIAKKFANKTNVFNETQFKKSYAKVIGMDVYHSEPWLQPEMSRFVRTQVRKISGIQNTLVDKIENIVTDGARLGLATSDMADDIEERMGVCESSFDFIARDQIAKFNGHLMQERQTDAGIESYEWSTSQDDRVRKTHEELDGQIFRWDDPPVTNEDGETNHPGEDYQCRCVAIPHMEEILNPEGEGEETPEEAPDETPAETPEEIPEEPPQEEL